MSRATAFLVGALSAILVHLALTPRLSSQAPAPRRLLVFFAQDHDRWTWSSRYVRGGVRPDLDGRYKVTGLPAAEYHAVALDHVESGQWSDPEFLDRIRFRATSFTLNDGESRSRT